MTHSSLRTFIRHILQEDKNLDEGGNLGVDDVLAQKIEIARVQRDRFVRDMRLFFKELNKRYQESSQDQEPLYKGDVLDVLLSGIGFGGSTAAFFDLEKWDELFKTKKKTLGDIDIYIPRESYDDLYELIRSLKGQEVIILGEGRSVDCIGMKEEKGDQINALFGYNFIDPDGNPARLNMQIDFVKARFTEEGLPHSSIIHSHGSSPVDLMEGIKGFAKIYLLSALTTALTRTRGKEATAKSTPEKIRITKSSEEKEEIPLYSYSTAYGLRRSKKKLGVKDGYDVYVSTEYADEDTLETPSGFKLLFGVEPSEEELKMFDSYIGTLQLIRKYLFDRTVGSNPLYESIFKSILYKCFNVKFSETEPRKVVELAQSSERSNFDLDREVKEAMIDKFLEIFPELENRRHDAEAMMDNYYFYLKEKKGTPP